jgi:hypothetical protein
VLNLDEKMVAMNDSRERQYLPGLYGGDFLVPAVRQMRDQLTALEVLGEAQARTLALHLDQLPYALGAAYLAVSECIHAMATVANAHPPVGKEFVVVPENERFRIGYKVDAFLDAARRAQNAILHYWSRALNLQLGKSLGNAIEPTARGESKLPPEIQTVAASYWEKHGRRVKAYRDLCQHYGVVISDVRVLQARNYPGRMLVFAALPNNPEAKSGQQFTYTRPVVQALEYIIAELIELLRFVNASLTPLLLERTEYRPVTRLVMRSPVRNGQGEDPLGSPVPTQEVLRSLVRKVARQELR